MGREEEKRKKKEGKLKTLENTEVAAKALTANTQPELFGETDRQTDGWADVCWGRWGRRCSCTWMPRQRRSANTAEVLTATLSHAPYQITAYIGCV